MSEDKAENPGDWLIARWERKGLPVIIRMAIAYRHRGPIPGYGHKIVIVIKSRHPQSNGMPPGTEVDDLERAELAVRGQLEAGNHSLCVLAITGCGTRDLIFYTRNPEEAEQRIQAARSLVVSHEFEAEIQPDHEWELYGYFDKLVANLGSQEKDSSV
jgi:hypothetical protein